MKGRFIVIYGINNVGKSTQCELLAGNLKKRGYSVELIKYPVYDLKPSGPYINDILRNGKKVSEEEVQMWYTINRYQYQERLFHKLKNGKVVISECYIGTGVAWGTTRGVSKKWLIEINKFLYREDLAIYLTGKRHLGSVEKKHRNERDEKLIDKCWKEFDKLAKENKWRKIESSHGIEETQNKIMKVTLKYLRRSQNLKPKVKNTNQKLKVEIGE